MPTVKDFLQFLCALISKHVAVLRKLSDSRLTVGWLFTQIWLENLGKHNISNNWSIYCLVLSYNSLHCIHNIFLLAD